MAEVIFSPSAAQHGRSKEVYTEDLDEYVRNARFLLAEHKSYSPDEIVALEEQRIEVVVRSAFEEPHPAMPTVVAAHLDARDNQSAAVDGGVRTAAAASESEPGPAPSSSSQTADAHSTDCGNAGTTTAAEVLASGDAAYTSDDGGLVLRTYVTESATGQTINHVRID